MGEVVEMGSRLKVARPYQEISAERIAHAMERIEEMNLAKELSCLAFVGLARDGKDHIMGVIGDENTSGVDILAMLELLRSHTVGDHDSNESETSAA